MPANAPTNEIGYTLAPSYNRVPFDDGETTPELVWPQSIYVYDAMRRTDAQVGSVLRAVTETLLRTPWRIDPAGARARVTKFVADDLGLPIVGKNPTPPPRLKDRFSWPSHLREALLMLPMGHAYFEQVYRITDDGNAAHLRKLAYRPAKTIEQINVASDGGLISIQQYWTRLDREPKPIPVDHLVAYIHAKEGANWLGTSILRNCYKNWLLKDRLLRVQAQTIERNGMGIPLYTAAETETDLTKGLGMATSWRAGEAAGSAVPFGATLKLVGVEGTLPDAMPVVEYHDSQIARAVLAHFLNLGQQTGSWALGTTFADFFTMSLQTLAEQIRDTATQHIVEDLVDHNFGPEEPAPRLVFDEIGSRQAATAQAIKTLVDAGVIHPDQVLEESSRQQYGLPPADPSTATPPPGSLGPTPPAPTQMGDTSPSVSASAAPKGLGVEAEGLFDEEADEWEDAIDALIVALDELSAGRVEAAFNPKQARNPKGSPGGGRFRSMVDRLKDAITEHGKGGGKGHPLDGFDREQLRRAAKARGIELKRGEPRDSIAEKLLGHLGGGVPKPAKKVVKKAPPKAVTGREALAAAPVKLGDGRFSRGGRGLRREHVDALDMYVLHEYRHINEDLRRGIHFGTIGAGATLRIDAVMDRSKLTHDVIVHRGVADLALFNGVDARKSLVGMEYIEDAYFSATADKAVAGEFHRPGGALLNLRASAGIGAIQVSDFGPPPAFGAYRPATDEAELLLQRGLRIRIVGDKVVNRVRELDGEVVPA